MYKRASPNTNSSSYNSSPDLYDTADRDNTATQEVSISSELESNFNFHVLFEHIMNIVILCMIILFSHSFIFSTSDVIFLLLL